MVTRATFAKQYSASAPSLIQSPPQEKITSASDTTTQSYEAQYSAFSKSQNNYVALVILRCLQSAGASSTIALAYAIISDISTPTEHESYMAILMGLTNAAPSLGPVLGGILAEKVSWHWISCFLVIFSCLHLLAILLFLPETSRRLVGDGSIPPARMLNRSPFVISYPPKTRFEMPANLQLPLLFPNPLTCLVILRQRATLIVLVVGDL